VAKLKKHKIFPDLHASGKTEPEPEQPPSDLNPEYDVEPLAATLRERLELTAMLDASEQSTSARSQDEDGDGHRKRQDFEDNEVRVEQLDTHSRFHEQGGLVLLALAGRLHSQSAEI
jgi:hypothetical protein